MKNMAMEWQELNGRYNNHTQKYNITMYIFTLYAVHKSVIGAFPNKSTSL